MITTFSPTPRTLMGPGPSDVHPRILTAMAKPTIGHLDPEFIRLMDEIKVMLQEVFQTQNALTIPLSAPGSAGMEASFVNLIEPGDKVMILQNGVFGGRMAENVRRFGGNLVLLETPWGRAIDPEQLRSALQAHPDTKIVAFVHAETSTGVRSDAKVLCELAQAAGCLTIVDCVTSLVGCEVDVDGWGADVVYSGTQKCLSCAPGLSPFTMSERAASLTQTRKTPVSSWFLDMNLVMGYWGPGSKRAYHHTAPVNALYGLHEALLMATEEGLAAAWARHTLNHQALKAGLEAMGLRFFVPESERLAQLNLVEVPAGVDEALIRKALLGSYNLEIGAGLGPLAGKVWRIGLMGHASRAENVLLCVSALEAVLAQSNAPIHRGQAIDAVQSVYAGA
ncbi:MAG: alanine--glyoxylate aminotransferase family protein [Gammaproteobacteria bacterium]|jgi:alanine-glyoxylate transaminase/serine-glyoxylate transaminase/serine-pyruvate transaminase|nr:alanine--glyoxylate aminotransferase family protein [Gammaproteobacteria bacterium]MBT5054714.1 alanine--glyoxylate aminotransferase family protein [Gammaproteobacteria bacterium]